ncbi:metal ABC transporter ATP-binding protein [Streptomyces roseifaciens]
MTGHIRSRAVPAAAPERAAPERAAPALPAVSLRGAALAYGDRVLWRDLDLDVRPGEFLAVLGPNGSGKTSLLRVLLGRRQLTAGRVAVLGMPPRSGSGHIGYVPQHKALTAPTPLRARDLVRLGLDGHRWGLPRRTAAARQRVEELLAMVGAGPYADVPLGLLSGGELQSIRIAQALAPDPQLLLCDEPLLSLDPHHQRTVTALVDARRRSAGTAVVFVTHEINPVLGLADRVLYLAPGGHRVGATEEVMTSATLSRLYGTRVDVVRVRDRIVVVGAPDDGPGHSHERGDMTAPNGGPPP